MQHNYSALFLAKVDYYQCILIGGLHGLIIARVLRHDQGKYVVLFPSQRTVAQVERKMQLVICSTAGIASMPRQFPIQQAFHARSGLFLVEKVAIPPHPIAHATQTMRPRGR